MTQVTAEEFVFLRDKGCELSNDCQELSHVKKNVR